MTDLVSQTKQALTGTAQDTIETATQAAKEVAGTAQEQASQVLTQAASQTSETVAHVKEQAGSVFVDQRDRAVAGLAGLADALRETGRSLANSSNGNDNAAQSPAEAIGPFLDDLAGRFDASADFLKDKDVRQLIDDAEALARRQPVLFVGALFGIGMVGARLLKGTLTSTMEQQAGQNASPDQPASRNEPGSTADGSWARTESHHPWPDPPSMASNLSADVAREPTLTGGPS